MFNVLGASAIVAFAMAWAIGAQDVSNALGTSVGSKALSVRQAIVVGAVFEFLGSLMGGAVATTISKGVISPADMPDQVELYVLIMFSTLCGAFMWLAVATYFCLPVSTTHSLVGSLLGLGAVHVPWDRVNTSTLRKIVLSWVTSPVVGLVISYCVFYCIYNFVLTRQHPKYHALRSLPYYYGFTFGILTGFLALKGPLVFRLDLPHAGAMGLSVALLTALAAKVFVVERHYHKYLNEVGSLIESQTLGGDTSVSGKKKDEAAVPPSSPHRTNGTAVAIAVKSDRASDHDLVAEAEKLFSTLMVVTACVVAFAHGSNDVSNSVGPFAAIVEIYMFGTEQPETQRAIPAWILMAGGLGIVAGLATYGHKVMATVGEKITKLTFTRGFSAQIATALTVLSATLIGLSVSTTHCLIGAVAGVGLVESYDTLNIAVIQRIALSWAVTMPASAFFSLAVFSFVTFADKYL